jgi:ATP-dependent Lhr-like helicase
LQSRGASFFHEITTMTGVSPADAEQALAELVAAGAVTSDSFAGLRAMLTPGATRLAASGAGRRRSQWNVDTAGRWAVLSHRQSGPEGSDDSTDAASRRQSIELHVKTLLGRWGVIFRRLLDREPAASPSWRDIVIACRRLEARGDIRGGRFVHGFAGEQFALPEAVPVLRTVRREDAPGELIAISAADPLNLTGIVTPGNRVPAIPANRVLYRDGTPIALREAGEVHSLAHPDAPLSPELEQALTRRSVPRPLRRYLRIGHGRTRKTLTPGA